MLTWLTKVIFLIDSNNIYISYFFIKKSLTIFKCLYIYIYIYIKKEVNLTCNIVQVQNNHLEYSKGLQHMKEKKKADSFYMTTLFLEAISILKSKTQCLPFPNKLFARKQISGIINYSIHIHIILIKIYLFFTGQLT
jgi:N-dimethylarginine dimethylaminohydrolase